MKKIWIFTTICSIFLLGTFVIFYIHNMSNSSPNDHTIIDTNDTTQNTPTQAQQDTDYITENQNNLNFQITSPAFLNNGKIPVKYCDVGIPGGQNISIPLQWRNIPQNTKSLFLVIVDPHPVANNWIHWIVKDIPTTVNELKENASKDRMPAGAIQLKGTQKDAFYHGPQPPAGTGSHPYEIHLYALNIETIDLEEQPDWETIKTTLKPLTIQETMLTGYYP